MTGRVSVGSGRFTMTRERPPDADPTRPDLTRPARFNLTRVHHEQNCEVKTTWASRSVEKINCPKGAGAYLSCYGSCSPPH